MTLTPEQIDFYETHGYLLLERHIGVDVLERIHQRIGGFIEASRKVTASNEIYDVDPGHGSDTPAVRRLKDPVDLDPVFRELAWSDAIVDPVAQLLGGTVRFDHSKLNFKPPGSDARILWHQDWAFYPHTNDDMLAVGVMLEDCTEAHGPMRVIPGSHRGPVYDHHVDDVFAGGVTESAIADQLESSIDVTGPAGSVSLHHVRLLHGSRNNRTETTRPLLLFSYAAVDAFPVFNEFDIDEFDSRIIRGRPVRAGRMEARPFRIPVPRNPDADSIYDNQDRLKAGG